MSFHKIVSKILKLIESNIDLPYMELFSVLLDADGSTFFWLLGFVSCISAGFSKEEETYLIRWSWSYKKHRGPRRLALFKQLWRMLNFILLHKTTHRIHRKPWMVITVVQHSFGWYTFSWLKYSFISTELAEQMMLICSSTLSVKCARCSFHVIGQIMPDGW